MSNPPAFPLMTGIPGQQSGMTMRDYFAAQVIMGSGNIIQDRRDAPLEIQYSSTQIDSFYQYRAEHAYRLADAMLLERHKEK